MKTLTNKGLLILMVIFSGFGYITSCTHENDAVPEPATTTVSVKRGTDVLLPGNMTIGNPAEFKLDKSHSNVMWQTNYVGAAGLLTGRFNQFGMHEVTTAEMIKYSTSGQPLKDNSWAFYENDPSKTFFSGYVQINTSNTGEPGRDNGCNISSLGTTAVISGVQNLEVINLAKIKTTKVEFDPLSADYIVTLDLTWKGNMAAPVTKSVVGKLKYIKKATVGATTATPYDVFGLQLVFQFNCRDFGITSTSISDKIEIQCNVNFNNK